MNYSFRVNIKHFILTIAILFGTASVGNATILGFGQIGGSNTSIEGIAPAYGSNAAVDANGLVVSNGATPNVSLTWGNDWDVHTSDHFAEIENHTIGGGDWDNEGPDERIGQLDADNQIIVFAADAGYAVVINSFDFGNTEEALDSSVWDLAITDDSDLTVVWSQQVTLDNAGVDVMTIAPNFTGVGSGSYTLSFDGVSGGDGDGSPRNGRHAIDNLSFNQVPEPASLLMFGCSALLALALRRR